MKIETIKTPGLAALSYVITDGGQAVVIDPRRDIQAYLDAARDAGATVTHIFETHRHEDFVTGSVELAERTGAAIHHGRGTDFGFGAYVDDGDAFELGDTRLTVRATPGHTDDSISLVLRHCETGDSPLAVFTGDALFVGDVGRTDFHPERTEEDAETLYQSIHETLLELGDQCVVYPAHGAGSVCGSGMADRDFTTIGYERAHNPLLQLGRREFVEKKASEEHPKPPYFARMERLNKSGPEVVGPLPLARTVGPDEVEKRIEAGDPVVDVREPQAFAGSHVPGSINIPMSMLPSFAGWLLDGDAKITLIGEGADQIAQARTHLRRLGYEETRDFLRSGITAWEVSGRSLGQVPSMPVEVLRKRLKEVQVVDVRKPEEWALGHLPGARHMFLGDIPEAYGALSRERPIVTFCGSGRRAMIAASLLRARGVDEVHNCFGSMKAWQAIDGPLALG